MRAREDDRARVIHRTSHAPRGFAGCFAGEFTDDQGLPMYFGEINIGIRVWFGPSGVILSRGMGNLGSGPSHATTPLLACGAQLCQLSQKVVTTTDMLAHREISLTH